VPLLFWSKNLQIKPGSRDELVQMFDVAPTILEAAGLPIPADFEARTLWGALSSLALVSRRALFAGATPRAHLGICGAVIGI
jgi:arylsulfatase A-like enzyme